MVWGTCYRAAAKCSHRVFKLQPCVSLAFDTPARFYYLVMRWFRVFTQTCVYNMWFVLITTWLASNKLSSVKRAQTVHQSYDEYPSRELVLAVGMFILAIGKKVSLLWWHIICFNELLFITVNISWAELLVCASVFCFKVYGPNRPFPLSPAASLSPSSGEGLHWRPWWLTSRYTNKGGLPGETAGAIYLRTGSLEE